MHQEEKKEIIFGKQWQNCRCGFGVHCHDYAKAIITQGEIHFKRGKEANLLLTVASADQNAIQPQNILKPRDRVSHVAVTTTSIALSQCYTFASVVLNMLKVTLGNTGNH